MTPRKSLIIIASAALLGLFALFAALKPWTDKAPEAANSVAIYDDALVMDLPLTAWSADEEARRNEIEVDAERGPILQVGDADPLLLTPTHPALKLSNWRVISDDSITQVVADGMWNDAPAVARWHFAAHNPQAYFSLKISKFPVNQLRQNIALRLPFPEGALQLPSPAKGVEAQAVIWADDLGLERLSVSNWSGDALQVAGQIPNSEEARELLLSLWPASAHLESETCADTLVLDLEMNFMLTIGAATPASVWPYADGSLAALTPIFGLPAEHSDPQIAEAAAPDARRWLLRAHTLVYGHSDPSDPRYGNGGLLGYDLGATIIVPAAFGEDPAIQDFAQKLDQTRVELAPAFDPTKPGDAYQGSSHVLRNTDCAQLSALAERRIPAAIITQSAPDEAAKRPVHQGPANWPLVVLPEGFDGRLQSLRLKGFDPSALGPLLEAHQTRVFSAPFVATRNPLIGAAHESLLHPERGGHWTVSTRLGGVMANLELWREESPIMVSSVAEMAQHRASIQQVKTWWRGPQQLQILNPMESTIQGFTLAIEGEWDASAKGSEGRLNRRVITGGKGRLNQPTTLIWWDLKPGLEQIDINPSITAARAQAKPGAPATVRWEITAP